MMAKFLVLAAFAGLALTNAPLDVFGQAAKTLTEKEKRIVTVAAFTAAGEMESLKAEFPKALDAGLTVNEIREILIQMYAYAGFPRSLNGLGAFVEVLQERKARGIDDPVGMDATPLPEGTDMNAYGERVRNELAGLDISQNPAAWARFAPVVDDFLKEHLFGAIFARDVLDHRQRELATIGALSAMRGTEGQLRFHLNFSLNTGLTIEQLQDFVLVLEENVGAQEAETARALVQRMTNDERD